MLITDQYFDVFPIINQELPHQKFPPATSTQTTETKGVTRLPGRAPFTLKAQTQNIYTKLGVHSRIEAINKARAMDLL